MKINCLNLIFHQLVRRPPSKDTYNNRKAIKDKVNMILTLIIGIMLLLTYHFYKKFSYFRNKGLTEDPGYFPLGSSVIWKMAFGSISIRHMTEELYINYPKDKCVGYYGPFGEPILLVRDLDLMKRITVKDFSYFADRRDFKVNETTNYYYRNMLTNLKG